LFECESSGRDVLVDLAAEAETICLLAGVRFSWEIPISSGSGPPQCSFMHTCSIPQDKFYTIPHSYFTVDLTDIISDNVPAEADLVRDFTVLESLGHQFYYA